MMGELKLENKRIQLVFSVSYPFALAALIADCEPTTSEPIWMRGGARVISICAICAEIIMNK